MQTSRPERVRPLHDSDSRPHTYRTDRRRLHRVGGEGAAGGVGIADSARRRPAARAGRQPQQCGVDRACRHRLEGVTLCRKPHVQPKPLLQRLNWKVRNRAGIIMCKETLLHITSLLMLSHARAGGGDLSGIAWAEQPPPPGRWGHQCWHSIANELPSQHLVPQFAHDDRQQDLSIPAPGGAGDI